MQTPSALLISIPNVAKLSPRAHILLLAFFLRKNGQTNFGVTDIHGALIVAGLKPPSSLPRLLSNLSKGAKSSLMKIEGDFALTLNGEEEIQQYIDSAPFGSAPTGTRVLDQLIGTLGQETQNVFLSEVAACMRFRARRASMILAWCLTLDHLKNYILKERLVDFNQALSKRTDHKNFSITQPDDFLELKNESVFIEICRSANIVTNDVRKILDAALGYRNTCAHPNDIVISESKVTGHVEDLVHNVILKYPLVAIAKKKNRKT